MTPRSRFSGAAKKHDNAEAVQQVREVARQKQWCGQVNIIEQRENQGIAHTTINAVTEFCGEHGRVIVLEDDLILSPFF